MFVLLFQIAEKKRRPRAWEEEIWRKEEQSGQERQL